MFSPAVTGSGVSVLEVICRSALACTVVVALAELFALTVSSDVVAAVAVLVITVPEVTLALTLTTSVNTAVSAAATSAFEKTMLPVPPTGTTSVRAHPGLAVVAATRVVPVGTASVTVTLLAVETAELFLKFTV